MKTAKEIAAQIFCTDFDYENSSALIEDYTNERTQELQKQVIRLRLALEQCKSLIKLNMGEGSDLFLRVEDITDKAIRKFE